MTPCMSHIYNSSSPSVLTDSTARKHLKKISLALSLSLTLTFYVFRKAGTIWAFNHSLQDIMLYSPWSSRVVRRYINSCGIFCCLYCISFPTTLLVRLFGGCHLHSTISTILTLSPSLCLLSSFLTYILPFDLQGSHPFKISKFSPVFATYWFFLRRAVFSLLIIF